MVNVQAARLRRAAQVGTPTRNTGAIVPEKFGEGKVGRVMDLLVRKVLDPRPSATPLGAHRV
jgi:hypothetical protein